jgi:hypothetical protein
VSRWSPAGAPAHVSNSNVQSGKGAGLAFASGVHRATGVRHAPNPAFSRPGLPPAVRLTLPLHPTGDNSDNSVFLPRLGHSPT